MTWQKNENDEKMPAGLGSLQMTNCNAYTGQVSKEIYIKLFTFGPITMDTCNQINIVCFAFHAFLVEDSQKEQKSSQGQTTQLPHMHL